MNVIIVLTDLSRLVREPLFAVDGVKGVRLMFLKICFSILAPCWCVSARYVSFHFVAPETCRSISRAWYEPASAVSPEQPHSFDDAECRGSPVPGTAGEPNNRFLPPTEDACLIKVRAD